MATLLPSPGGLLVHDLGFVLGKLLNPSSYCGPALAKSGFGPLPAGMNVGKTPVGFGGVPAALLAALGFGAAGVAGVHAWSSASAPPERSPAAVNRMQSRRFTRRRSGSSPAADARRTPRAVSPWPRSNPRPWAGPYCRSATCTTRGDRP